MVAGHLREKRGKFHIVLNYLDNDGKRKTKWVSTGLAVKGNKKKAESLLMEARRDFVIPQKRVCDAQILFSDFLEEWLEVSKPTVQLTTYSTNKQMVKNPIKPFFESRGILLCDLQVRDIQSFYTQELKRVKANTVIHYHAIIHRALKYAVKLDLIAANPADRIERPKVDRFIGNFYNGDEVSELLHASSGTKLEIPIILGIHGLRRSEVLGLKWDAVNFEQNTITVKHTINAVSIDGVKTIVAADRAKNKTSLRTLPMIPLLRERLLREKEYQEKCRKLCGTSYNKKYLGYVCVNEIGDLTKPNYVSTAFPILLKKNGLRHIRFHDLRHSCASLLLSSGVEMKNIQEWLGHSDFSTTANIYAHLAYNSKVLSASALADSLGT